MKHEKICNHCQETYLASKRNQKYCSNSCRVTACYERNQYEYKSGYAKPTKKEIIVTPKNTELKGLEPIDDFSKMDIGGAFIGSGLAIAAENLIKNLIPEENKPLTLKQSKELTKQLMDMIYKHDKILLSKLNTISKQLTNLQKANN